MKKIQIDTYYDITCQGCSQSWSTDFKDGMGMDTSKSALSRRAYAHGWRCIKERTLCPDCAAIVQGGGVLPIDMELED